MATLLRAMRWTLALIICGLGTPAAAHCDGLDGPVVTAARQALAAGDPSAALIWVQPHDEPAIRDAFAQAAAVRRLGPAAQALADRYFFETLVRLHRAGEGAPFNGLQPAGRDLGPAIPLADRAVETGSAREVTTFLNERVAQGVRTRLEELRGRRGFAHGDIPAGREYVRRYVAFVHYVEGVHVAAESSAGGHFPEAEPAEAGLPEPGHPHP